MFVDLIDVKINNVYNYRDDAAPTVSEKAPTYAAGETWLDLDTGFSYILTDATLGTWTQIETAEDNTIALNGDRIFKSIIKELNNPFIVPRNGAFLALDCGFPSYTQFDRQKAFKLVQTESIYSNWAFVSGTKIMTAAGVYGDISALIAGDMILVQESRKNNGYYTIADIGDDFIEVAETLKDETGFAFVSLVDIPDDFTLLVGRLIWWDVFKQPEQSTGIQSESIGTYSYTLQDMSKRGYPADVLKGIVDYSIIGIGGESYFVN